MKKYSTLAPKLKDLKILEDVIAPWDLSVIARVECISAEHVDIILDTAYSIFSDKSLWLKAEQRIEILSDAISIMQQRQNDLAIIIAREGGKPLSDAQTEVGRAIDGLKSCVECIRTSSGKEIPMNLNTASANRIAVTRKYPIGVVVAASAFNHPLNLVVHQVGPAIAAGCPVIIKPALKTPLSCHHFVEILREAGLPDAYCQAVNIKDHIVTEHLITDPRVAFFSFIGSADVGWRLRSQLSPGTRCALEHGGAAPVIITQDADISDALPLIAKGGFYHAGQVCVSVQRVIVHSSLVDTVVGGLADIADKMIVGDPEKSTTEVGPLIRPTEVERIDALVQEAVHDGAQLVSGGKRLSETTYACTILLNPPQDSAVSCEEIFGPVICIYSYDDLDEAINFSNSLNVAFQASIFTQDINTAMYAHHHLDAATVIVNDHTAFRVDWMPFAGLRTSGMGTGGIPYTYQDLLYDKLLVIRSDGS